MADAPFHPESPALLDEVHLDRQTFGDRDLAREVLVLFDAQAVRLAPAILDASLPAVERADAAHTLKGAARGVGAAAVAALAERIEGALRAGSEPPARDGSALRDAVAATRGRIAEVLARG